MERLDLRRLRRPVDVYFVRHGESEGNRKGKILGRMDLGLSELGRDHARAAGRFFAGELDGAASDPAVSGASGEGKGGARVYLATSPLLRCRETTALIRDEAELPEAEVRQELIELDTGIFSGKGLGEIARDMPGAFATFRVESWEAVEGAEGIASLYSRAVKAWELLVDRANGGADAVIAVTHAGFLQWLLKASFAGPEQAWMPVIKAANCGIFHCHLEPTWYGTAPATEAPEAEKADGFFAEWRRMNYIPYGG